MTQQATWAHTSGPHAHNRTEAGQNPYGPPPYGQPQGHPYPTTGHQGGYPQQVPGQPGFGYPMRRPTNAMAIVALVLGLTVPPGGLICGIIARKQIKETGEEGDGLALAGLIIGAVVTGIFATIILGQVVYLLLVLGLFGVA